MKYNIENNQIVGVFNKGIYYPINDIDIDALNVNVERGKLKNDHKFIRTVKEQIEEYKYKCLVNSIIKL